MATYMTYNTAETSNREDLSDVIYDISPTDTPFMSAIGRGTATSTMHEWQTDTLGDTADASGDDANKHVEGANAPDDTAATTQRLHTYMQILSKDATVSGTQEVISHAGIKSQMAYQLGKRAKELKRDLETTIAGHSQLDPGSSTEARQTAGFPTWVNFHADTTPDNGNVLSQAGAATSGTDAIGANRQQIRENAVAGTDLPAAGPVLGVPRALTESMVKDAIELAWADGGDVSLILAGSYNKRVISQFSGGSTRMDRGEDKRLTATFDVYISDFGEHRVVPSRFQLASDLLLVDPEFWSIDYLRPFQSFDIGKVGDKQHRQILAECGLRASNPSSSALVADLTSS